MTIADGRAINKSYGFEVRAHFRGGFNAWCVATLTALELLALNGRGIALNFTRVILKRFRNELYMNISSFWNIYQSVIENNFLNARVQNLASLLLRNAD